MHWCLCSFCLCCVLLLSPLTERVRCIRGFSLTSLVERMDERPRLLAVFNKHGLVQPHTISIHDVRRDLYPGGDIGYDTVILAGDRVTCYQR